MGRAWAGHGARGDVGFDVDALTILPQARAQLALNVGEFERVHAYERGEHHAPPEVGLGHVEDLHAMAREHGKEFGGHTGAVRAGGGDDCGLQTGLQFYFKRWLISHNS